MPAYTYFEIRVPKTSESSPEAMVACLKALPRVKNSLWDNLFGKSEAIALEIVTWNQRIYFMAAIPAKIASYFSSQIIAQYPAASISQVGNYMPYLLPLDTKGHPKIDTFSASKLALDKAYFLPLKTYEDYKEIDPLSTTLGTLAKSNPKDKIIIQFLINSAAKGWQAHGSYIANKPIPTADPEKTIPHPQKALIESKVSQSGLNVGINILAISSSKLQAEAIIANVAGSFATVTNGEGNSLTQKSPFFWQKSKYLQSIIHRQPIYTPRYQVLTVHELATIFHLPNQLLKDIRNIAWGGTLKGEPPENLPTSINLTEDQKRDVNFFAKTEFKSTPTVFGIKTIDRRKHVYIIGKTGVGKSTLIANMAINDMRNGKGVAIIDPHGDLVETVLDYIPSHRLNDVVYLNPNITDAPFRMNPLEVYNPEQAELVASGIVAIFHKLFAYSWGPRLEYILRNTLLTLTAVPNSTLLDVPKLLTNTNYRKRIVEKLQDPVLVGFWNNEFAKLDQRQQTEAISPILNKVGQFITSPKIRMILERPRSSVNLEEIMNSGKILLLNLSQGLIGEDNAALLGAMFITKIQLAAMNRVTIPENQRRDFYLYVDEFQNFATSSFVKILSEARKYRLNLTVANQYMAQVEEELQSAIFGNIGTLISFLVGSSDATHINQEFGGTYEESDLVNLDNFEIITKLSIDNRTTSPFPAKTLPLPFAKNQNREKAIMLSNERYGKPDKKKELPPFHHNDVSAHEIIPTNELQEHELISIPPPPTPSPTPPIHPVQGGSSANNQYEITRIPLTASPPVNQTDPDPFAQQEAKASQLLKQFAQTSPQPIASPQRQQADLILEKMKNPNYQAHHQKHYHIRNKQGNRTNQQNRPEDQNSNRNNSQNHRPMMVVEEE